MKIKLRSRSGKSMVLALIFLLFCLSLGGTVLASAFGNASRTAGQAEMEQCYVNQRSAMLLLADLLKGTPESKHQLTVEDIETVTEAGRERTLIYTIHGPSGRAESLPQKLLYLYAAGKYEREHPGFDERKFVYKKDLDENWTASEGMLQILPDFPGDEAEPLEAAYRFSDDYDFTIVLKQGDVGLYLTMDAYWDRSEPVVTRVDGRTTTTVTTVICWEDPVIGKGDGP